MATEPNWRPNDVLPPFGGPGAVRAPLGPGERLPVRPAVHQHAPGAVRVPHRRHRLGRQQTRRRGDGRAVRKSDHGPVRRGADEGGEGQQLGVLLHSAGRGARQAWEGLQLGPLTAAEGHGHGAALPHQQEQGQQQQGQRRGRVPHLLLWRTEHALAVDVGVLAQGGPGSGPARRQQRVRARRDARVHRQRGVQQPMYPQNRGHAPTRGAGDA